MIRSKLLPTVVLIAAALTVVRADDARPSGDVEAGFGKGRVTTPGGEPIAGVAVSLENTMFDSHAQTKTDKDGRYRIELTKGSWHVTARVTKMYHDERYVMDCTPADPDDFAGPDGGVRDFIWNLSGPKPEGRGHYGSPVVAYNEGGDFSFELKDVELTLSPDGPLINGTKGRKIAAKVKNSPDGWCIADVPVGRYVVSTRLAKNGKKSTPMKIKIRNSEDDFAESVTADFIHNGPLDSLFKLDVLVKP